MKGQKLSVDIQCNLTVSEETAVACLKLVELYVNANRDVRILSITHEDGTKSFYFAENEELTCADLKVEE